MSWNQFSQIEDFKHWIEQHNRNELFNFKSGSFSERHTFFSQFGNFFNEFMPATPTGKDKTTVSSPVGGHTRKFTQIEPTSIYAPAESFSRQGDILSNSADIPRSFKFSVEPDYWIIVSQTCSIDNDEYCSLVPGFLFDKLGSEILKEELGVKAEPRVNLTKNFKSRFLGLPAIPDQTEDSVVFDLSLTTSAPTALIKSMDIITKVSIFEVMLTFAIGWPYIYGEMFLLGTTIESYNY